MEWERGSGMGDMEVEWERGNGMGKWNGDGDKEEEKEEERVLRKGAKI